MGNEKKPEQGPRPDLYLSVEGAQISVRTPEELYFLPHEDYHPLLGVEIKDQPVSNIELSARKTDPMDLSVNTYQGVITLNSKMIDDIDVVERFSKELIRSKEFDHESFGSFLLSRTNSSGIIEVTSGESNGHYLIGIENKDDDTIITITNGGVVFSNHDDTPYAVSPCRITPENTQEQTLSEFLSLFGHIMNVTPKLAYSVDPEASFPNFPPKEYVLNAPPHEWPILSIGGESLDYTRHYPGRMFATMMRNRLMAQAPHPVIRSVPENEGDEDAKDFPYIIAQEFDGSDAHRIETFPGLDAPTRIMLMRFANEIADPKVDNFHLSRGALITGKDKPRSKEIIQAFARTLGADERNVSISDLTKAIRLENVDGIIEYLHRKINIGRPKQDLTPVVLTLNGLDKAFDASKLTLQDARNLASAVSQCMKDNTALIVFTTAKRVDQIPMTLQEEDGFFRYFNVKRPKAEQITEILAAELARLMFMEMSENGRNPHDLAAINLEQLTTEAQGYTTSQIVSAVHKAISRKRTGSERSSSRQEPITTDDIIEAIKKPKD